MSMYSSSQYLETCASNFKATYDTFYNKVKQKQLFGNHQQNTNDEEDDDDQYDEDE